MGRNILINKDIPLSKIRSEKARIKSEWAYFEKLTFIEDVYGGENVNYAIENEVKLHKQDTIGSMLGMNWASKV